MWCFLGNLNALMVSICLFADRAIPRYLVFKTGELGRADGSPGVQFSRRDSDFCPHAKFAPISKLGRGIVHNNRTIDALKKSGRCFRVLGQDAIRMI